MPTIERLDLDPAGGVVALVPATQIDHATRILNRQSGVVDRTLGRGNPQKDDEEQP